MKQYHIIKYSSSFIIFLALLVLNGCLVETYTAHNQDVMNHFAKNETNEAVKAIEHNKQLKEPYNKVLLGMEKSRLLYLNNQAAEASKMLFEVENRLEDWNSFFKRDITGSKEVISDHRYTKNGEQMPAADNNFENRKNVRGAVTTTSVPTFKALYKTEYLGTYLERPMVNYMIGLCGIKLKDEKPLVEAKKLFLMQDRLNTRKTPIAKNIPYTPNPFIDMCTGFFYEQMGVTNDAFIAYERAFQAFKEPNCSLNYGITIPNQLLPQLIFLSKKLGYADRVEKYEKLQMGMSKVIEVEKNALLLIEFNMSPRKYNRFVEVDLPDQTTATCNSPFIQSVSEPVSEIKLIHNETIIGVDVISNFHHTMLNIEANEIRQEFDEYIRNNIDKKTEGEKITYSIPINIRKRNYDTRTWQSLPLQIAYCRANFKAGLNIITLNYTSNNKTISKVITINYSKGDKIIPVSIID